MSDAARQPSIYAASGTLGAQCLCGFKVARQPSVYAGCRASPASPVFMRVREGCNGSFPQFRLEQVPPKAGRSACVDSESLGLFDSFGLPIGVESGLTGGRA